MIDYKLAKQLKEAGWKQKGNQGYCINETGEPQFATDQGITDTCPFNSITGEKVYEVIVPTLPELIEACGDRFHHLVKVYKEGFMAGTSDLINEDGKTPEIAVAKLWLQLQKK